MLKQIHTVLLVLVHSWVFAYAKQDPCRNVFQTLIVQLPCTISTNGHLLFFEKIFLFKKIST